MNTIVILRTLSAIITMGFMMIALLSLSMTNDMKSTKNRMSIVNQDNSLEDIFKRTYIILNTFNISCILAILFSILTAVFYFMSV